LKTFGRDGKLPEFCDVSNTVLPGLYLQGIHVTKKIRQDFTMTKTYKINCDQVEKFLEISDEESKNRKSNEMEAISHLLPAKTSPTNRSSLPSFNTPTSKNPSSMHQSSKSVSAKPSFTKPRTNLLSSSSFAQRDQSPASGFSSDSNSRPVDNYQVPYKVRLDDFDWYVPKCDRGSVAKCLPTDARLKNGAFVVRSSTQSSYALSVVFNPDSKVSIDLSNSRHFKHITINEIKKKPSSNGESEIDYYINTREDVEGKFSSILELVDFYKATQLSVHFNELNTCLFDVFEETEGMNQSEGTSFRNQIQRESLLHSVRETSVHQPTPSARNRPERSDSRTFRSGSQSVHVNNLPEPISSDMNQTMFDVAVIPRAMDSQGVKGSYNVLGYCCGEYQWSAQDTNQFDVNIGELFCVVGTAAQGWLPVVQVPQQEHWPMLSQNSEGFLKRYIPEQYVTILHRPE